MKLFGGKTKKSPKGELDLNRIPKHIGVIMDGNGRWAKRRGLPRKAGHRAGAENLETICVYCNSIGVEVLTAYAFSTENWSRPQSEVDELMDLLYNYLLAVDEKFGERDMKLKISGDREPLSDKIKEAIAYAEETTGGSKGMIVNIALNYGGRSEIVRAARIAAEAAVRGDLKPGDIDEEYFDGLMYTGDLPEVDLIIRPSGEKRLSNFLLWQAAYSEFWYSDICWPDFKEKDMERAIIDFQSRNRRFGNIE